MGASAAGCLGKSTPIQGEMQRGNLPGEPYTYDDEMMRNYSNTRGYLNDYIDVWGQASTAPSTVSVATSKVLTVTSKQCVSAE